MPTVLIGGGSGMVGSRLSELLRDRGYEVLHLSRRPRPDAAFPSYQWDVNAQQIDKEAIRRADYVVNLAGAGIADKRWTDKRKKQIIDSRVKSTRLLLAGFERLERRPKAFLSAAAIGYYGDRGDELLREEALPGEGFLPESCQAWEAAIDEVRQAGIRSLAIRQGIVLSTRGGALERMMQPARFALGTYFGDGSQWYSWIHIDDACRMFIEGIENEKLAGTYNGVAPQPETNKELTRKLLQAMGRPTLLFPVPAFLLRIIFGEMADTILDSTRVSSEKIEQEGFSFRFPKLGPALKDLIERKG